MAAPIASTFEIKLENHAERRLEELKITNDRRVFWAQVQIVVSIVHMVVLLAWLCGVLR
jgi:hypothetical protein